MQVKPMRAQHLPCFPALRHTRARVAGQAPPCPQL